MSLAEVSIVVLLALFAATALRGFNLGIGAFAAAFILGAAADINADQITTYFPSNFFVLLVGVTALFAVADRNGTLDWLLSQLLKIVRGNPVLMALVPFIAGAVIAGFGTLPAAATAIVAPIAMGIAARYGLPYLMMAVVAIMGILSGILSPLAVYGVTAREQSESLGIDLPGHAPVTFLAGSFLAGVLLFVAVIAVSRMRHLLPDSQSLRTAMSGASQLRASDADPTDSPEGDSSDSRPSLIARVVTLGGMAAVLVLSIGFDMNIGYLGMTVAAIQMLLLRMDPGPVVADMPWPVMLLIGGLLTYIALMSELGAFERISELLTIDSSAMLTLLLLCYIAGITSFAASSIAVFVTTMPLLPAVIEAGAPPIGAVLAVAVSSVIVDINPLGITGGLILGAAPEEERSTLFRQLLIFGLGSVLIGPLVVWAVLGWW